MWTPIILDGYDITYIKILFLSNTTVFIMYLYRLLTNLATNLVQGITKKTLQWILTGSAYHSTWEGF